MDRQKVTFKLNKPEVAKLDRDNSKEVPGREGPQYMRILDGDTRILFADPELEQAIIQSGATKGDVVQIVKRSNGWQVGIVTENRFHQQESRQPEQSYVPGNPGNANGFRLPPQNQHQPPAITPQSLTLVAALKSALDAAAEAERYAATQGRPIRFEVGDIRAMANSIICREGGR